MWKGFIRESISYINPKGLRGWVKFIVGFPKAWVRFMKLEKEDGMGKKWLWLVVMVICGMLMVSGAYAYTTWQEASDAGTVKFNAGDMPGARADFIIALTLTAMGAEKSDTQLRIGYSYFNEKNYTQARIEFSKVLEIVDGHSCYKLDAQNHIGHSYYQEKNYVQGIIEFTKVVDMVDAPYSYTKSNAQLYIGYSYEKTGDNVNAFNAYKKVFDIKEAYIDFTKIAFDKIVKLQSTQVTDWKAHVDWMTLVAVSIPSTSQEYTDFAGQIISERDKLKKIYGIQ